LRPARQLSVVNTLDSVTQLVHDRISPAEVRLGERVTAVLLDEKGATASTILRVWRISPIGVEFVYDDPATRPALGASQHLEINVGNHKSELYGVVVAHGKTETGADLVGMRLFNKYVPDWGGQERRVIKRWTCPSEFMPKGVAPNPVRFNDFIYFRVADVSAEGMRLITSLRNKILIPGMQLRASVSLPMVAHIDTTLKVENARIEAEGGKDVLMVGCSLVRPTKQVRLAIGEYVFQFGPSASLEELRAEGLTPKKTSASLDFRFVKSEEDFKQVLELRRLAYASANKIKGDASLEDVTDVYDSRSRIIIATRRGQVVASMRLIYSEIDDRMEHEEYVEMPASIPRRDEICEITRVCTHPDFRKSDVLLGLFRFCALTVVQSGRRYILGCATKELLPIYTRIGLKPIGVTYANAALNGIEHSIFLADVAKALTGVGVGPLVWNVVWGDLSDFMVDQKYLEADPLAKLRMGAFKTLKPVATLLQSIEKQRTRIKR
jgi:predicted GNAT family N-acyltransferase